MISIVLPLGSAQMLAGGLDEDPAGYQHLRRLQELAAGHYREGR